MNFHFTPALCLCREDNIIVVNGSDGLQSKIATLSDAPFTDTWDGLPTDGGTSTRYRAPERRDLTTALDVWAVGVIVAELALAHLDAPSVQPCALQEHTSTLNGVTTYHAAHLLEAATARARVACPVLCEVMARSLRAAPADRSTSRERLATVDCALRRLRVDDGDSE